MRSRTTLRLYGRAGKFLDLFAEKLGKPKSKVVEALIQAYFESAGADRKYVTTVTVKSNSDVAANKILLISLLNSLVGTGSNGEQVYEVKHGEGIVNAVYNDYVVIDGEKYYVHRSIKYMLARISEGVKVFFDYVEPHGRNYKRIIRLYLVDTEPTDGETVEDYEY